MLDTYTQRLIDEYACRRTFEKYWWTEGQRDSQALASLFTEDAKWGAAVGREAIIAQAEGYFEGMRAIATMANAIAGFDIEFDGDQASGFVRGIAHLLVDQPDGTQKVVVVDATYAVEWRRVQGEWLISRAVGPQDSEMPHNGSFQTNAPAAVIDYGMVEPAH